MHVRGVLYAFSSDVRGCRVRRLPPRRHTTWGNQCLSESYVQIMSRWNPRPYSLSENWPTPDADADLMANVGTERRLHRSRETLCTSGPQLRDVVIAVDHGPYVYPDMPL